MLNVPQGSWIYIEKITEILDNGKKDVDVYVIDAEERSTLKAGCLINYYRGNEE